MSEATTARIDLAKRVFQQHGADVELAPEAKHPLSRATSRQADDLDCAGGGEAVHEGFRIRIPAAA